MDKELAVVTLGGGCFWCTEAVFQNLQGVEEVVSGYTAGNIPNPTYNQICTGTTGHAEVIRIRYDPDIISFEELLYVFWRTHDPTTLNRQGADRGTQYRSIILYRTEEEKEIALRSKVETNNSDLWSNPIVTEIRSDAVFYPAEKYHQDYYNGNRYQPYCIAVIDPKIQKLKKVFGDRLK